MRYLICSMHFLNWDCDAIQHWLNTLHCSLMPTSLGFSTRHHSMALTDTTIKVCDVNSVQILFAIRLVTAQVAT